MFRSHHPLWWMRSVWRELPSQPPPRGLQLELQLRSLQNWFHRWKPTRRSMIELKHWNKKWGRKRWEICEYYTETGGFKLCLRLDSMNFSLCWSLLLLLDIRSRKETISYVIWRRWRWRRRWRRWRWSTILWSGERTKESEKCICVQLAVICNGFGISRLEHHEGGEGGDLETLN